MVGRLHEICRGTVLTPEACAAYRDQWDREAGNGDPTACIHRGEVVGMDLCEACGGKVQIKRFACAVYGECQLYEKLPGIKGCSQCREKVAIISG